jgi:hypothetical protein
MASSCEHGNEPSDSIEGREFFYWLSKLFASKERLRSVCQ